MVWLGLGLPCLAITPLRFGLEYRGIPFVAKSELRPYLIAFGAGMFFIGAAVVSIVPR
jgi:hypothetical protein